jgi:hypothetical protein
MTFTVNRDGTVNGDLSGFKWFEVIHRDTNYIEPVDNLEALAEAIDEFEGSKDELEVIAHAVKYNN